ncbi:MAG: hypothetical protein ACTHMS_04360 [Jatrophihabitans sp.]|uniref:hypothetical protein n=1 Tax=Jatrophihabitans sp. TaxID=1932789 RepID=UPI003F7FD398
MRLRSSAVVVAACALAATAVAAPATAASTTSAYSAAGYATPGSLAPVTTITGSLGGLVGPLVNPALAGLVNPLVAALTQAPQTVLAGVLTGIVNAGNASANNPISTTTPSGQPSCATAPWNAGNACYSTLSLGAPLAPLVNVGLQAANGYTGTFTNGTGTPVTAVASAALTDVSVLGLNVVGAGTVTATSSCPTTGSTSATAASPAFNGLGLFGNAVSASVASGTGLLSVLVGGNPLVGTQTVTIPGGTVSLTLNSNLLTAKITITPSYLLQQLGLSVAGSLMSLITASNLVLTLTVGPGAQKTTSSSQASAGAWGLEVGADLSGSLDLTVAGLVGIDVALPTGITSSAYGNLLDLKLAYTTCSAVSSSTTAQIPPGVN